MADRTSKQNIAAAGDVLTAADRLADAGLASRDPRGINDAGMATLADLLAVLTFQTGNGTSKAEQAASATARAMLAALGDLYSHIAGQEPDAVDTQKLLAQALRTVRKG